MRRGFRGVAVSLLAVIATMAASQTPASAATVTVAPGADSFVLSTDMNANRGMSTVLRIHTATKISYLRFTVPPLASGESVTAATLRVFATTPAGCTLGVEVVRAAIPGVRRRSRGATSRDPRGPSSPAPHGRRRVTRTSMSRPPSRRPGR